jgi:hypothetical protein
VRKGWLHALYFGIGKKLFGKLELQQTPWPDPRDIPHEELGSLGFLNSMTFISPMANKLAKCVFHAANIKRRA